MSFPLIFLNPPVLDVDSIPYFLNVSQSQTFVSPVRTSAIAVMRSVQDMQGSMPAMMIGMSATYECFIMYSVAGQLASVGARTFTRSGLSVPFERM